MMLVPNNLVSEILKFLENSICPFLLGITGSMAVGKTTFSFALKEKLEGVLGQGKIALISTDGFLYSNSELERRRLLDYKGFPDSFNEEAFWEFLESLRRGDRSVWKLPFYDQTIKDIHPTRLQRVERSDIYLLEGINLLFYLNKGEKAYDRLILLDKEESQIFQQFHARFLRAFKISGGFSPYFQNLDWKDEGTREARLKKIWREIHIPFYYRWVVSSRIHADWVLVPSFDPNLL